jgi:hypothetical protein
MRTSLVILAFVLAAACDGRGLPANSDDPTPIPMQASLCTIEPDAATPPEDPLLDVRLEVFQGCAYCNPVTVAIAEVFPLEGAQRRAGRWLGSVLADYGTQRVDRCDVLEAGVPYPALATFLDLDGNDRCDPGVDRVGIDQRYTWGFRDEVVKVSPLDRDIPLATAETCALLPPR